MNRKGISIAESIVAASLLSMTCAYLCPMLINSAKTISESHLRYSYTLEAEKEMEEARQTPFDLLSDHYDLKVFSMDVNTKSLEIAHKGIVLHAVRSRY